MRWRSPSARLWPTLNTAVSVSAKSIGTARLYATAGTMRAAFASIPTITKPW